MAVEGEVTPPRNAPKRPRRKLLRWLVRLLIGVPLLLVLLVVCLYLPPVQELIRSKGVAFLQEKIGTRVELQHFALRFPLHVELQGLYVEDQRADTLLYAGEIRASLGLGALIDGRIQIGEVELLNARAKLVQAADSTFNFDYIIQAFASDAVTAEAPSDTSAGGFSIAGAHLKNVRFSMNMRPSQLQLETQVGDLRVHLEKFDPARIAFHVDEFALQDTWVHMRTVSGPAEPDTYPLLTNPTAGLDVRVRKMDLKNVQYSLSAENTRDSLWIHAASAKLSIDSMDLDKQMVAVQELVADGVVFGTLGRDTSRVVEVVTDPSWLDQNDGFRYFLRDRRISARHVRVQRSSMALHVGRVMEPDTLFDPAHLVFTDVACELNDVVATNDRLAAQVHQLSCGMGPGDHRARFSGAVQGTEVRLDVNDARVQWDQLAAMIDLHAEQGSLTKFYRQPDRTPIALHVTTEVNGSSWRSLRALLPAGVIPSIDPGEVMEVNMRVAGTVAALDTLRLIVLGDQGSELQLHARATNIREWPNSTYVVDVEPLKMGPAIQRFMLAYAPDSVLLPQQLLAHVHVKGDAERTNVELDVRSDLGDVRGTAMVAGWQRSLPDAFNIDLNVTRVDLQRLTGDTAWDPISLHVRGEGSAMNTAQRKAHLEVVPKQMTYRNNNVDTLLMIADVIGDTVNVNVDISSAPAAFVLHANGTWPHAGDSLRTHVDLAIEHLRLKQLDLTENDVVVSGRWRGHASMDSTGHVAATLNMDSTLLAAGRERFLFNELMAHAHLGADSTSLHLDGDAVRLAFDANIGLDTLAKRVVTLGRSWFTTDTVYTAVAGERFSLRAELPRKEWVYMVVPDVHTVDIEVIEASYDGDADKLTADLSVPKLIYDSLRIEHLVVAIDAERSRLIATVNVERLQKDAFVVTGLAVEASGSGGKLNTTLRVENADSVRYLMSASITQAQEELTLHLNDGLVLNSKAWTVDPANALHISDQALRAEHFVLHADEETITLSSRGTALRVAVNDLRMNTITNIVTTRDTVPIAEGRMTGTVDLPAGGGAGLRGDLTIHDLRLLGTDLGTLQAKAAGTGADRYTGEVHLIHGADRLDVKADATLGEATAVNANAVIDLSDISFMQPFASGFLYELKGAVKGNLHYVVQGGPPSLDGQLRFDKTHIGVVFTGATYTIPDGMLTFDRQRIRFDRFSLLDSANNVFRLDGEVSLADPKDPRLDLRVNTDRFQFIGSTIQQNRQFFGDLYGSLGLRIKGTVARPKVEGDIGILAGTHFSVVLPGSQVQLVNAEGIVVFTDDLYAIDTVALASDAEVLRDSLAAMLPGVELDLNIHVDKEAMFAIVLDPMSGDQATVSGSADLVFRYAPDQPMYLSGPFVVENGAYTLEFYGLVKKRFELVQGGTVRWYGDVTKAEMDVKARYLSETAPVGLFAANGGMADTERNRLQQPLPFSVIIGIKGGIASPDIDFALELDRSLRNSYPKVSSALDQLNQTGNEEQLNKQVFGLLVLNSFIQDEGSGGTPSSAIATSAARNSVNGLLTDQMNKLTGRYIKGVNVSVGVNTYDQVSGQQSYQRTSVDYKVSKRVLNERLSVEVGGSVGVDEQNSQASNVSNTRAAQYAVLYDLTRDGRFRIRGFHENAYDLYDGEITNSGIAIMFTQDIEENQRARASGRKAAEEAQEKLEKEKKEKEEQEDREREQKEKTGP